MKGQDMTENIDRKTVLDSASVSGLALGGVCIIYATAVYAIDHTITATGLSACLKAALWAAKFVGCIFLMRYFMQKLAAEYSITNRTSFKQGVLSALFSALIVSGATLAQILFIITPEGYEAELAAAMSQMSGMLDANSQRAMQEIIPHIPVISFFSTFIYCFLYGTVLAAILSRYIPQSDPFADYRDDSADGDSGMTV